MKCQNDGEKRVSFFGTITVTEFEYDIDGYVMFYP